jgi:hypothetical protein
MWKVLMPLIVFLVVWTGLWMFASWEQQQSPQEPYVCNSITSTGAPTDCHPVVLPPDVLKKYEDQFRHK